MTVAVFESLTGFNFSKLPSLYELKKAMSKDRLLLFSKLHPSKLDDDQRALCAQYESELCQSKVGEEMYDQSSYSHAKEEESKDSELHCQRNFVRVGYLLLEELPKLLRPMVKKQWNERYGESRRMRCVSCCDDTS